MRLQSCSGLLLLALAFSTANSEYLPKKIVNGHQVDKRDADEETPFPRHVTPNNYILALQPFFDEGIFRGRVEINISCHEPTDIIVFHAYRDLEVVAADKAIHSIGTFDERSVFRKLGQSHHYSRITQYSPHSIEISQQFKNSNDDRFVMKLKSKMTKGTFYHFQLEFNGNISTSKNVGFYRRSYTDSESKEERWYASINLNKKNARKVFPCFDDPQYKASVQLSVIVNKSYMVVSSMPLHSTVAVGDNDKIKLEQFQRSPPMSLQSLGLFISEVPHFKPIVTGVFGNTTIYGYGDSKLTTLFQSKIKKLIAHMGIIKNYIGFGLPLPQLHLIALPSNRSGCAKDDFWGLLLISEDELHEKSLFSPMFFLLPKQWVGYMVTPDSQSVQVNNGLQLFLGLYGIMKQEEEDKDMEHTIGWTFLFASELLQNSFSLYSPWYDELRIAGMWRMLNYSLTAQTVSFGLYSFLNKRKFQIYNEMDIYIAVENQAWLDGMLPESKSVEDIVKSWNGRAAFPIVTVTRNYGNNSATIEQHPCIPENYPNVTLDMQQHLFWVPITYISENNRYLNYVSWMKDKKINIKNLPSDNNYIIIDPEQIGMFPVNYDKTNWDLLIRHLKTSASEGSTAMFPENIRLKLLYEAIFMALKRELDFGTAMDLTLFMRHERSLQIWSMMNRIVNKMSYLLRDTPVYDKFLVYCRYMYAPIYENIKNLKLEGRLFKEFPEDVYIIAAEAGYEPAVDEAKIKFQEFLKNLSHSGSECAVFRWSDENWELGLQRILNTVPSNETSKALFSDLVWCNRKPKNLIRILHLVFADNKYTFSNKDVRDIIQAINDYDTLLNFIRQHWDEIKLRYGNNLEIWNLLFEIGTKDVKTVEDLQLVLKLYEEHQNDLQTAKGIVENSIKLIQENLNGKYMYVNDINKWLDMHLPEFTEV